MSTDTASRCKSGDDEQELMFCFHNVCLDWGLKSDHQSSYNEPRFPKSFSQLKHINILIHEKCSEVEMILEILWGRKKC